MSMTAHDQYIDADEEEETCPLCIEALDLTDKGFRPCPCGYQVCQFCYNSIKNNMNGLCPACRRQYDDKQIEYKVITPEETAAYKARQAQKQKKTQAALQKERQKAEADSLSRKHLAGLRVVQKNLVYVTGIAPKMQEDELLQTLRGEKYFGQYGKIIKIVVSKARDKHDSVGVYVTYERKDDAANCIAAVDGNVNGDRTLRAQFGTTKYCSAYLRGDTCMNRSCMFLHEPGEAKDSYSRADLSALNATSSQQGESRPPPPQSQQPVSAAAQPMARQASDRSSSPVLSERPALPSTASWASRPLQSSRAESRSTSGAADTPASVPVLSTASEDSKLASTPIAPVSKPTKPASWTHFHEFISRFNADEVSFSFKPCGLSEQDIQIINNYPALFDLKGGARIRARRQREEEARRLAQETQLLRQATGFASGDDESDMRGSMQLGGEPEDLSSASQPAHLTESSFEQQTPFAEDTASTAGLREQAMTPQLHQQMLLQSIKAGETALGSKSSGLSQPHSAPGHQRNASRFSFANDTATASATVKPVANQKLMAQQSTMMPPANATTHYGSQQQGSGFFTSNVQGPPPGLKSSGTPPVSGGMTFAQGHGFTTGGLPYGSGPSAARSSNDEMLSSLMRARGADAAAKHEHFPPLGPARQTSISSIPPGLQGDSTRRSTPSLPPGLEAAITSRNGTPTIPLDSGKTNTGDVESPSRPSSRAGLRRVTSTQIIPVVPLRVSTPVKQSSRPATPLAKSLAEPVAAHTDAPSKAPKSSKLAEVAAASTEVDTLPATLSKQSPEVEASGSDTVNSKVSQKAAPQTGSEGTKRKHPGKLDISAVAPLNADAVHKGADVKASSPLAPTQAAIQPSASASFPSSPSTPSIASPASRPTPRTIRVVQTPKTETPPPIMPSQPPPLSSTLTAARQLPSRQPSIASMNMPGTPSSEHVSNSDNISITSTSQSRANSPPPMSKIGSAPVRTKTKSQLKKERQERAKAFEEVKVDDESKILPLEEPAQEAIVSRKKKSKKEKEVRAISKQVKEAEEADEEEVPPVAISTEPRPISPARSVREVAPVVQENPAMSPITSFVQAEPSPPPTPTFTPAQFIAELRAADATIAKSLDAFFRVPAAGAKVTPAILPEDLQDPASWQKPDYNISLTREEVDSLLNNGPEQVAWDTGNDRVWSRTLISPGGAQLRALFEEQELRYLDLEEKDMARPEELRFRPTKPQNETAFPTFDLKALKKAFDANGRGVSVMEQMVQDGSAMKKGAFLVDEASKYINEFVMPPATPPQSSGRGTANVSQQQSHVSQHNTSSEQPVQSLEAIERQLQEAKKAVDEREGALRRAIRKNKKLLGLV